MSPSTHDIEDGQKVRPHEKDTLGVDGERKETTPVLQLDKHGLPLVPQPSDHKDDPLVSISSEVIVPYSTYITFVILSRLDSDEFLTAILELVPYVEVCRSPPDLLSGNGRPDGLGCYKPCFRPLGTSIRNYTCPSVLRADGICKSTDASSLALVGKRAEYADKRLRCAIDHFWWCRTTTDCTFCQYLRTTPDLPRG